INRDKDVIIYVNDEIVGQGSVTKLAQQDLGNKYFSIPVSSRNNDPTFTMSIAHIKVTRGLVSSLTIKQDVKKWQTLVH
ncbi:MAG: hypothetical protein L3J71_04870, partial [Victivallaceae bacterium]|nr:hypothetical protein [Victivallaceae bacterium]